MIDPALCYESLMCLGRYFKVSSLKELSEIEDIENARKICEQCEDIDYDYAVDNGIAVVARSDVFEYKKWVDNKEE